jgi:phosphoserine aminotransferase
MKMKKYNFYAGPSILNSEVLKETLSTIDAKDGLSLLEISHRSKEIVDLFEETKQLVKELMQLEDRYEVLFLHGGARLQNCMIPYNFCTKGDACYLDTGLWSKSSYDESCIIRPSKILASSAEDNYSYIPKDYYWDGNGYLHITSNNTIHGTQFFEFPKAKNGSLIVDMCSDVLSRQIDFNQFGLIYAGLQKNLGTAGGTLVVVDKNLLEDLPHVPSMLNYKKHVEANSMLNTPPVFTVILCNIVLKWIIKKGGLQTIDKLNKSKSEKLYAEIDRNPILEGFAKKGDRSLMNATFELKDKSLNSSFSNYLKTKDIIGFEGHRSKGGYRISMYNMLPENHIDYLVEMLQKFSSQGRT